MNTSDLRNEMHHYIDNANEESLNFLKEALETYKARKFTDTSTLEHVDPKPMTIGEYQLMIEKAEVDIRNGKVYSEEEVDQKFKILHEKLQNKMAH